ncbi:hypothetical protein Golomagni_04086 [Golovinomyces magnicellulatus]|nr:hypothetical protein Golomagni_04086 [Golovinomyces magnicellulatus]
MSQSGPWESSVSISEDCIRRYQELKLLKKHKFIIYKLSDNFKTIEVDDVDDSDDWDVFREKLINAETKSKTGVMGKGPRYAIYDFNYELSSGEGLRNKIMFISWSPDTATTQAKMIYASSKHSLRVSLDGVSAEIQANDSDELEYQSMLNKISKGMA